MDGHRIVAKPFAPHLLRKENSAAGGVLGAWLMGEAGTVPAQKRCGDERGRAGVRYGYTARHVLPAWCRSMRACARVLTTYQYRIIDHFLAWCRSMSLFLYSRPLTMASCSRRDSWARLKRMASTSTRFSSSASCTRRSISATLGRGGGDQARVMP